MIPPTTSTPLAKPKSPSIFSGLLSGLTGGLSGLLGGLLGGPDGGTDPDIQSLKQSIESEIGGPTTTSGGTINVNKKNPINTAIIVGGVVLAAFFLRKRKK